MCGAMGSASISFDFNVHISSFNHIYDLTNEITFPDTHNEEVNNEQQVFLSISTSIYHHVLKQQKSAEEIDMNRFRLSSL